MNHRALFSLVTTAGLLLIAVVWAQQSDFKPAPLPSLQVDTNAPLLLDDSPPPGLEKKKIAGPKLICTDCHGNYLEETLAVTHSRSNIFCITCHGESYAHASDEGNVTPPDIMYAREDILPKCWQCHVTHNARAADVLTRYQERGLQARNIKDLVCTDCHGEHRILIRKNVWDKHTGALISSQPAPAPGGEM